MTLAASPRQPPVPALQAALVLVAAGCASDAATFPSTPGPARPYAAGSATFCVVDPSRGFDPTAGIVDGRRLIIVEAWYPIEPEAAASLAAPLTTFGDYFGGDLELLLRTERSLLTTSGFAPEVVEQHLSLAPAQLDVPRASRRLAPVATQGAPFPVVLYSHGTLQQRFTNDTAAENLARQGYVVLAPEHTGNDALAPFGSACGDVLEESGVLPAVPPGSFDVALGEYRGQTFDPFFIAGAAPGEGHINPVEVAMTLDRGRDLRAALRAARTEFGALSGVLDADNAAIIGYSRGAMHGLVAAELMPEVKGSVSFVGGTPLRFYTRDAEAVPLHTTLADASGGARSLLDAITKPVLDIIGGEDSRRKATSDVAASIGVYATPTAENPSPIVRDSFDHLTRAPRALVTITDIDHFDLVDDPFVVAYRAQGGISRPGAFDPAKTYVLRPLEERQQIRDHYVQAWLDVLLRGAPLLEQFAEQPFAGQGVSVEAVE